MVLKASFTLLQALCGVTRVRASAGNKFMFSAFPVLVLFFSDYFGLKFFFFVVFKPSPFYVDEEEEKQNAWCNTNAVRK